jgi:type I restriction enzyme, S subunit
VTAGLKPYPARKDSGMPWLGEVPEHWGEKRAKFFFREVDDRSIAGGEELLSVSHKTGVTPRREKNVTMFLAESNAGHKLCRPGDVVVNTMWAWMAALGVSRLEGLVSPSYGVYRPYRSGEFVSRYLDELLRTPAYRSEYVVRSTGITSSRLRLYPEAFLRIPFLWPPLDEQNAIVRFLDHADRQIRRYIRAKEKLIKLLEEQKQVIVHRAVTRGLDPSVRLKPSGIEWLGDVPEHWEVMRLARVIADGPKNGISPAVDERGVIESFSISAVREGKVEVRPRDVKYVSGDRAVIERTYRLLRGDVLLVRGNGNIRLVGRAGLVEEDMPGRVYPDLLMRVRVTCRCLPRYLVFLLNCRTGRDQIEMAARTAVGTFKINNQQVRQLVLALPPAGEQQRILNWLSKELGAVTTAAGHARDEIDLLREYRTRLIADVVAGKLDVREAAAALPDEDAEPEPLDDTAAVDPDEAGDDEVTGPASEEDEA